MASPTHLWLLDNAFRGAAASIAKLRTAKPGDEISKRDLDRITDEVTNAIVAKLELGIWEFGGTLEGQVRDALTVLDKIIQTEFDKRSKENPGKTPKVVYESVIDIIERGDFIENLLSQSKDSPLEEHIPELEKHLSAISNMELVKQKLGKEAVKAPISKLHRDTQPDKASAFTSLGDKKAGVAAGYVATRETAAGKSETFMVKSAEKAPHLDDRGFDTRNNTGYDTMSFFNEFVTSELYRRMLYERTPVIAGIEATAKGDMLLRSKFLNEFSTVTEYTGGEPSIPFGEKNTDKKGEIVGVSGAGKLMAALLAGGEQDMHAGNIGVMTESDGRRVYSKIDHGRSATMLFTNGESMWQSCYSACQNYGYGIKIPINVTEFRESLDQILMITPDEIEKHIKARIHELRKTGFDPKGLEFMMWTDATNRGFTKEGQPIIPHTGETFDNLDQLEKRYIERFSSHWEALKQYRELVVAAEKMTTLAGKEPKPNWKSMWIRWISNDNQTDTPITYAIKKNLKIDGKSPEEYAKLHGIKIDPIQCAILRGTKIEGEDPTLYAQNMHMRDDKFLIGGKSPIEYAVENRITINGEPSLVTAVRMGADIGGKQALSLLVEKYYKPAGDLDKESVRKALDGLDPIQYAILENETIDGKSPIEYAILKGIKIEGKDPTIYASMNDLTIDGKDPMEYAVEKDIKIEGISPLFLAIANGTVINGKDAFSLAIDRYYDPASSLENQESIKRDVFDNKDPLQYAISKGKAINGHNPVDYALDNKIRLEGNTDPILFAMKAGKESVKDFVAHYKKYCSEPANKNTFFNDINKDQSTGKITFDSLRDELKNPPEGHGHTYKLDLEAIIKDFNAKGFGTPSKGRE